MNDSNDRERGGVSTRAAALLAVVAVLLLSVPRLKRIGDVYEDNYHGNLCAWFGMMAENMSESGFRETRFMPHVNPDKTVFGNFQYYLTHPVMDVVSRAVLVRTLGPHEWVARLNGAFGCALAAAMVFVFTLRRAGPTAAFAATVVLAALPMYDLVGHLSMHHAMTLGLGLSAWNLNDRLRERGGGWAGWGAFGLLLLLGMQWDWPGYFVPFLLWIDALPRPIGSGFRKRTFVALPILVALSLFWVYFHVDVLCGKSLVGALKIASEPTPERLAAGWSGMLANVWKHQLHYFGWGSVGATAAALVLVGFGPFRAHRRTLVLLALYGALNYIAFPTKGPFEYFWGCYWLVLVAFAAGLLADLARRLLLPMFGARAAWLVAGLALGIAATVKYRTPWDDAARLRAEQIRDNIRTIVAAIAPEDRGVVVTNRVIGNGSIVLAYARMNVLMQQFPAGEIHRARGLVRRLLPHLAGRRVLFLYDQTAAPTEADARAEIAALSQFGKPYHGIAALIDITSFVWN